MTLQAFFLDRDGVLNRERADYVKGWDEFEVLPGTLPALVQLAALNRPIVVITNQSAIGRGLVSAATVDAIHQRFKDEVAVAGGRIDTFYVCPHHPQAGCACRKPKPGLLVQAASDFHLELTECLFIGDSPTDFLAAEAAGCQSLLVQSGRQGSQLHRLSDEFPNIRILRDFAAAVATLV